MTLNDTQKQAVRKLYATFAQRIADKKEVEPTLVAQLRQELSAVLEAHKDWKSYQSKAQAFQHAMVHLLHADNDLLFLIRQQVGDRKGEGVTLNNISKIYKKQQDYVAALRYLEQSLAIQQQIGDVEGLATTLNNMGVIFWRQQQDAEQAVACFVQAYQIFEQMDSPNIQYPKGYLNEIREAIGAARFEAIVSAQRGVFY